MKNRLVEGFDPEYNPLSKTLKLTLVLDEEAITAVLQTSVNPIVDTLGLTEQVLELLERSIHLNAPRKMQQGPHGAKWNND